MARLGLVTALLVGPAAAHAQVLITEAQPNPDGADNEREWVEIHNTSTTAVSLAGWTINEYASSTDPTRESTTRFAFPATATIGPDQVWIIAQTVGFSALYGVAPTFELRDRDPNIPDMIQMGGSNFSLSNSAAGEAIRLRNAAGDVVDELEWGTLDRNVAGSPAATPRAGESLVRVAATGSSNADFIVVAQPTPFSGFGANRGPVIARVRTAPRHVRYNDFVTITASVSDTDGLQLVEINLNTATGTVGPALMTYQALAMTPTSSGAYAFRAQAENLAAGLGFNEPLTFHDRYIRFYINSEDTLNQSTTFPNGATEDADNAEYVQRNVMPGTPSRIEEVRAQVELQPTYRAHSVTVEGTSITTLTPFLADRTGLVISDGVNGIQISSTRTDFPTVQPGDVVRVVGTLSWFRGLTQITGPELQIVATGTTAALPVPQMVSIADVLMDGESYEGKLVTIVDADFAMNIQQWTSDGPGRGSNFQITDGTGDLTVRVWSGTNIGGTPAPAFGFQITGIVGQFDNEGDDGYQLWPRSLEDIVANAPPPVDAGPSTMDGGTPGLDATTGSGRDATTGGTRDAGVGGRADAGTGGPGGPGGGDGVVEDEGCGCETSSTGGGGSSVALFAVLLLAMTRRKD